MYNIIKEIDFNNSTYRFKSSNTAPMIRVPMHTYSEIKNCNMSIKKLKKIKSNLN